MIDYPYLGYFSVSSVVEPSAPSPSQRPGEDFFAWLDRMHANPPTVVVGEVYQNDGSVTEVVEVSHDTVRWRTVGTDAVQSSYRVDFEEWTALPETTRR